MTKELEVIYGIAGIGFGGNRGNLVCGNIGNILVIGNKVIATVIGIAGIGM